MSEEKKMPKRGVFWIVDDKLLAIPYDEEVADNMSKIGFNYNHRLLWEQVRPEHRNRRYDYYPRGRVEYTSCGKPVIIIGRSVKEKYFPEIVEAFEITEKPTIQYDDTGHYMSYDERMEKTRKKRRQLKRSRNMGLL